MTHKELKAKYEAKVAALDARMEEIKEELKHVEPDSEQYNALYDESMRIMADTNTILRAMGAGENSMYDI